MNDYPFIIAVIGENYRYLVINLLYLILEHNYNVDISEYEYININKKKCDLIILSVTNINDDLFKKIKPDLIIITDINNKYKHILKNILLNVVDAVLVINGDFLTLNNFYNNNLIYSVSLKNSSADMYPYDLKKRNGLIYFDVYNNAINYTLCVPDKKLIPYVLLVVKTSMLFDIFEFDSISNFLLNNFP